MTAYDRLVGLIGARQVTIPVRASEVDTLRAMLDHVQPTIHAGQRNAAEAAVRELDARIGALAAIGASGEVPVVPMEPNEHAALRAAFETLRGLRSGSFDSPAGRLMSTLDQRAGAVQARSAASPLYNDGSPGTNLATFS